MKGADPRG